MAERIIIGLVLWGCFVFIGLMASLTSHPKNRPFGVTFSKDMSQHPEIVRLMKQAKRFSFHSSFVLGLISFVLSLFLNQIPRSDLILFIFIYLAVLGWAISTYAIYGRCNQKVKLLKKSIPDEAFSSQKEEVAVSMTFRQERLTVSNDLLLGLGVALIIATILLPGILYDQIPYEIIIHPSGRSLKKSPLIFSILPVAQFGLLLLMMYCNSAIRRAKQQLNPQQAENSLQQNKTFRYGLSKYLVISTLSTMGIFLSIQTVLVFGVDFLFVFWMTLGLSIIIACCGLLWLLLGAKKEAPIQVDSGSRMVDTDDYWKWGLFYYNPNDLSVWIQSPIGVGFTCNWARFESWIFLVLCFIILTASVVFPFMLN